MIDFPSSASRFISLYISFFAPTSIPLVGSSKIKISQFGYLSEDRKRYGIVVQKSVAENSTMATMENFVKGLFINKKAENKAAQDYVDSLATKTPGVDQLVVNLSGGNQQKVVIAKWLIRNCDILIFDEPTRGIDVFSIVAMVEFSATDFCTTIP